LVNSFLKQFYSFVKWGGLEGSTIKRLYNKDILDAPISIPEPSEQTQIGSYFQNLDKLISLHQAKVNKLVNLKKAMLEKMFPKPGADVPEIRFKGFEGAWGKKRFGECVLIQRGGSPRPIENFITNDEKGINWIKIGDVSTTSRYITKTKEKIIPAGEKHSRRVYAGDLILSNSMSFGRPYIMAIEGCIHDGWLVIRDENKLFNLEYLLQLLSSDFMLKQYKALASGGVVINLNSELVQSTIVYVPNVEEQEKIGSYFQNLDKLITLHQSELAKLNHLKKACLEKMFV
jgi:type I restriction enzyme S subunit